MVFSVGCNSIREVLLGKFKTSLGCLLDFPLGSFVVTKRNKLNKVVQVYRPNIGCVKVLGEDSSCLFSADSVLQQFVEKVKGPSVVPHDRITCKACWCRKGQVSVLC